MGLGRFELSRSIARKLDTAQLLRVGHQLFDIMRPHSKVSEAHALVVLRHCLSGYRSGYDKVAA